MNASKYLLLIPVLALAAAGCAGKAKRQADIRRAYAAGEQAARAQMQQAQAPQNLPQQFPDTSEPTVRILGSVENPVLPWSNQLSLARALVEANYQKQTAPVAITIYRNNQPMHIDPQLVLQGADYPLFPGDIIFIQDQ